MIVLPVVDQLELCVDEDEPGVPVNDNSNTPVREHDQGVIKYDMYC